MQSCVRAWEEAWSTGGGWKGRPDEEPTEVLLQRTPPDQAPLCLLEWPHSFIPVHKGGARPVRALGAAGRGEMALEMGNDNALQQVQGDAEERTTSHCGVAKEGFLEVVTSKLPVP